jgi:acyl-CoA synthetase (AMP-forming)/AMP-acid ligase II
VADIIYPVTIVQPDPEDQSMPYRNAQGRCEKCKPNEVGLLIAPIDNKRLDRRFDGYTDSNATSKKIVKDVFKPGDSYFNTGDLLTRDELGFFYWSDRVGDTFRWLVGPPLVPWSLTSTCNCLSRKGENVATSEVEAILASCPQIADNTVYGVSVPGYFYRFC